MDNIKLELSKITFIGFKHITIAALKQFLSIKNTVDIQWKPKVVNKFPFPAH